MSTQLFRQDDHLCIALTDHACGGFGLQALRFLVLDGAASALVVSGRALGFEELRRAVAPFIRPDDLEWIICTQPIDERAESFVPWLKRTCVSFAGIQSDPAAMTKTLAIKRCGRFTYLPAAGAKIALCEHPLSALPVAAANGTRRLQVFDAFSHLLFDCETGARRVDARPIERRAAWQ